jgi:geranylgeranyl diphosphate synthase type I
MSLKNLTEKMLPLIEAELKMVVNHSTNPVYPELRGMLAYHLGWEGEGAGAEARGKRIRPLLVLLCAEAAGTDWRGALPAAAAVELLHNFSLIHDDIQDHSELRRGRPTLWVRWGIAQAINAGDVMFTQSFWALQRLVETTSIQTAFEANQVLQQTCLSLTEGQYLDLSYESRQDLPLEAYWPMIGGKTSALLGGCAELGALVGRAETEKRAAFREFGVKLGLAFQVLDGNLGRCGLNRQING